MSLNDNSGAAKSGARQPDPQMDNEMRKGWMQQNAAAAQSLFEETVDKHIIRVEQAHITAQ